MDATALRKLCLLVESPAVGPDYIDFARSADGLQNILGDGRRMTPSDAALLHDSRLVRSLANFLATTAWPSVVPAQLSVLEWKSTHYEYRKLQYVTTLLSMICDNAEDIWGVPHMAVLLQQACDGGIVTAMSGAGAALPAIIQSFAAEEAPHVQAFGLAVLEMSTTIFGLASYLSHGPGMALYGRHPAARGFWPAVRQQRSIELLTELTASCRGSGLWQGAHCMGRILTLGLMNGPVHLEGFSEAVLVCRREAARSSAVQTFVLETAAALCANAVAGHLPAETAVQMLESSNSTCYCRWIQFSVANGYWSPSQLSNLFKPSGFTSCMDGFIAGKPGASAWHMCTVLTAIKAAVAALGKVPGSPEKPDWVSMDAASREATEVRALGMARQAAALLQLLRLPKKRLSAARKAVAQGSLLGTPEQAVGGVPENQPLPGQLLEDLQRLVRGVDLFILVQDFRLINKEPSVVEPAEVLLAIDAVVRSGVTSVSLNEEMAVRTLCQAVVNAWQLAGSGAAPCRGAPGFIASVRKALPARASPAPLVLLLALPMELPTARRATLEAAPTIFRLLAECSARDAEELEPHVEGILMVASQHQDFCGPELAAAAAATIAPQSSGQRTFLRTVAAMAAQLVEGPAPDLETLCMSQPVAGCRHPMCRNLAGVSEVLMRTQLCGGCRRAAYCGPACQAAHWPAHRASCRVRRDALAAAEA